MVFLQRPGQNFCLLESAERPGKGCACAESARIRQEVEGLLAQVPKLHNTDLMKYLAMWLKPLKTLQTSSTRLCGPRARYGGGLNPGSTQVRTLGLDQRGGGRISTSRTWVQPRFNPGSTQVQPRFNPGSDPGSTQFEPTFNLGSTQVL